MVVASGHTNAESITLIRCPKCNKLLAKCAVTGMIEIACPRCKTFVRSTFS